MRIILTAQKKYNKIHDAVAHGDLAALEMMVKNGASINEVDDRDKFTPLHSACNTGALEVNKHGSAHEIVIHVLTVYCICVNSFLKHE